jgi:UrcA family protein
MSALRIIIASALITTAAIKAAPTFAEPVNLDVNTTIVRTADLDLTTKAGQRVLDHRLVQAASEVCGAAADVDLAGQNKVRACRQSVLAEARAKSGQLASRGGTITIAAR